MHFVERLLNKTRLTRWKKPLSRARVANRRRFYNEITHFKHTLVDEYM